MVDGASSLITMFYGLLGAGLWQDRAGGQPARRRRAVLRHLPLRRRPARRRRRARAAVLRGAARRARPDRRRCPATSTTVRLAGALRELFAEAFATRTRDEWAAVFAGTDACVTPVLAWRRRRRTRTSAARGTFVERTAAQPAPAPRFSRTPGAVRGPPRRPGEDTRAALADWGFPGDEVGAAAGGRRVVAAQIEREEIR